MADVNEVDSGVAKEKDHQYLSDDNIIASPEYRGASGEIKVPFGKREGGSLIIFDMHEVPHMLVCGFTGTGKTSFVQTVLATMATQYSSNKASFVIYDSKRIEYTAFGNLSHMFSKLIYSKEGLSNAIESIAAENRTRLSRFAEARKKDLVSYNEYCKEIGQETLPEVFFVIDDFAQCQADKTELNALSEILRNGRIVGIHMIIVSSVATTKVIPKDLLSNIPFRISFCLNSKSESKLILEAPGAEELSVPGEMLFRYQGMIEKCQCAYAEADNIRRTLSRLNAKEKRNIKALGTLAVNAFEELKEEQNLQEYDEYIVQAGNIVIEKQKAAVGMIQRVFKVGFNRANCIMNQLEALGVVGCEEGTKPREILMSAEQWRELIRNDKKPLSSSASVNNNLGDYLVEKYARDKDFTEETPALNMRDFEIFEVDGNQIGVKNSKIKYAIRKLTKIGVEGTLRTEFSGVVISGIIFKKSRIASKGFLEFRFKPGIEITNETPQLLSAAKDGVSNLTRIDFGRYDEEKVWQFAKQISEDIQIPITMV